MISAEPKIIPDPTTPGGTQCGTQIWFGDAPPSGSTVIQTQYFVGDLLIIMNSLVGQPLAYRCTGAPSSTNKDGVWTMAGSGPSVKSVSAAYSATATDDLIEQTNGAGVAVTLPAVTAANQGKSYTIKNMNGATTNTVVVAGGGAIDGGHTITLGAAYSSVVVRSDGTQYVITSSFGTVTVS